MIDTIKISVQKEYNDSFYERLLYMTEQRKEGFFLNQETGLYQRKKAFVMRVDKYDTYERLLLTGSIKSKSHQYNIRYRINPTNVDIEFSLPKFIYGSNVFQLQSHVSKAEFTCPYTILRQSLEHFFISLFPTIKINYGGVELKRFDFCYNQFYKNYEESISALKYIKLKYQNKTDRLNYEFGYVELSKSKYFKIYHKGEEFNKHDINKVNPGDVEVLQNISSRILRYEQKYTSKNWSYFYNMNYLYKHYKEMKVRYLNAKNKKPKKVYDEKGVFKGYIIPKMRKSDRKNIEGLQAFTIGKPFNTNYHRLNKDFFNELYKKFTSDIKKKYSIGKMSVEPLYNQVIKNDKNKTMNLRILALLKVFKSLKRAQEQNAISKRTYYRYEKYLREKGLSSTNVKSDIIQNWDFFEYRKILLENSIDVFKRSGSMKF